jgi:transposase-like protein/transposase
MKHKSDDYKISAVKYYLKNKDNIRKTCKIFDCSKTSLHRWIDRYKTTKNITRKNRTPISYKINKDQVKTAVNMIDKNEQLTIDELLFVMKQKYKDLDISGRHLGRVIRANNRTRKRTRHQHYPKERRKQLTDKNKEMEAFYNEVRKYPINKIICLDETSIGSHLKPSYSRCYIGKRCIIKTNNNFVFRSFTLLVAINNSKCVGKSFYEKGGTTKEIMVEFIETQIAPKYKDHLIILDNARSHNNDMVREAIIKSGNQYLFTIPYSPITNAIEMYFNQIKTYIKKNRDVDTFAGLEKNIDKAIDKVKPENYKNYFQYAYGVKDNITYKRKPSTRKCKLKNYKTS